MSEFETRFERLAPGNPLNCTSFSCCDAEAVVALLFDTAHGIRWHGVAACDNENHLAIATREHDRLHVVLVDGTLGTSIGGPWSGTYALNQPLDSSAQI